MSATLEGASSGDDDQSKETPPPYAMRQAAIVPTIVSRHVLRIVWIIEKEENVELYLCVI